MKFVKLQRLNEVICKSGMTEAELGRKVGVSRQSINQYKKGERTPSLDVIEKIAAVLNVDALWLLGYDTDILDRLSSESRSKVLEYIKDLKELEDFRRTHDKHIPL